MSLVFLQIIFIAVVIIVSFLYVLCPVGFSDGNFETFVKTNNDNKVVIMNKINRLRGLKTTAPKKLKTKLESPQKIKIAAGDITDISDLNNYIVPDDFSIYYFPHECPAYQNCPKIIDNINGLDRYFVPEAGHLITVSKLHKWSEDPMRKDFTIWKL